MDKSGFWVLRTLRIDEIIYGASGGKKVIGQVHPVRIHGKYLRVYVVQHLLVCTQVECGDPAVLCCRITDALGESSSVRKFGSLPTCGIGPIYYLPPRSAKEKHQHYVICGFTTTLLDTVQEVRLTPVLVVQPHLTQS